MERYCAMKRPWELHDPAPRQNMPQSKKLQLQSSAHSAANPVIQREIARVISTSTCWGCGKNIDGIMRQQPENPPPQIAIRPPAPKPPITEWEENCGACSPIMYFTNIKPKGMSHILVQNLLLSLGRRSLEKKKDNKNSPPLKSDVIAKRVESHKFEGIFSSSFIAEDRMEAMVEQYQGKFKNIELFTDGAHAGTDYTVFRNQKGTIKLSTMTVFADFPMFGAVYPVVTRHKVNGALVTVVEGISESDTAANSNVQGIREWYVEKNMAEGKKLIKNSKEF
ncbi:uncharacterized protein PAC_08489 [Phialocephala subalpina]|uniref:Uncharacterized protein n=1 Tax=Phialocephala subalpina TaxID=576137 RepID=A0A1L7X0Q4_9HELO|nr:uncharacterized protein PAC_08489 [Phialocephala subalpina]